MGTKGREIVGMDVEQLLKLLNMAFADEWLAYYQYWLGAKVVKGPMKEAVIAELLQHATDELRHAGLVAARIIQLGGTPVTEPKKWYEVTSCGYDAPDDPFVETILNQNIKGERCAIGFYKKAFGGDSGKRPSDVQHRAANPPGRSRARGGSSGALRRSRNDDEEIAFTQ